VYAEGVRVFVVNPGSTSTKLALVEVEDGGPRVLAKKTLPADLGKEPRADFRARLPAVLEAAQAFAPFDAVAARGGLLGPLDAGVYRVDEGMAETLFRAPFGYHPANLGAPLALEVARRYRVPAYVVDPPTINELLPEARVSGVPGIERQSRVHALNLRYVARRVAERLGKRLGETVLAGAHMGGGASVALFLRGRMADTSDALLGEGPFSANRAGTTPIHGVLKLVRERGLDAARHLLARRSGFLGLLGTDDLKAVEARLAEPEVRVVVEAYALQIAKNLAALAAHARPDAFFLTGAAARFDHAARRIEDRLAWIAPVFRFPGEFEAEALAEGVYRVRAGLEEAKRYGA
jgi:butyrate kinase